MLSARYPDTAAIERRARALRAAMLRDMVRAAARGLRGGVEPAARPRAA